MQQRALRLTMRKHSHATHDGLNWIRIDDAFLDARDKEGRLAAFEIIVQVDEESEEGGLASVWRRGVVLVGVCYGLDAGGWPCTVCLG
jgi:hypothetical protein